MSEEYQRLMDSLSTRTIYSTNKTGNIEVGNHLIPTIPQTYDSLTSNFLVMKIGRAELDDFDHLRYRGQIVMHGEKKSNNLELKVFPFQLIGNGLSRVPQKNIVGISYEIPSRGRLSCASLSGEDGVAVVRAIGTLFEKAFPQDRDIRQLLKN